MILLASLVALIIGHLLFNYTSKKTNIKIESDVVNVPTKERRVRFEVEEKPTKPISFLDKLKKIDVKDEIINHLKRIEAKQDMILSLLNSKKEPAN